MKLLHTSDWHVGKVLKGHDRLEEHRNVLAEIVAMASDHEVDAVIVAGDLFESAMPSPDAQALVWATLIELRRTGAEVVAIAGNHDNGAMFDALSPVFDQLGVTLVGRLRRPDRGGVVRFAARSTGEPVEIALLPYQSQRGIVTSLHLMEESSGAAHQAQVYAERLTRIIGALTGGLSADAVRFVAAHAHVRGGVLGGGEREAQTIFDYGIDSTAFPPSLHYVALGHLHRPQHLPGPCPIRYCGSPVRVDFGEVDDATTVNLVDAAPGTAAKVTPLPVTTARRLRTIEGTLAEILALEGQLGDDLLRIRVRDTRASVGLADQIRAAHPLALEVRIDAPATRASTARPTPDHSRSPIDLFGEYLGERGIEDDRLTQLFTELLHDATSTDAGAVV